MKQLDNLDKLTKKSAWSFVAALLFLVVGFVLAKKIHLYLGLTMLLSVFPFHIWNKTNEAINCVKCNANLYYWSHVGASIFYLQPFSRTKFDRNLKYCPNCGEPIE